VIHDSAVVLIARDDASDNVGALLAEVAAIAVELGISAELVVADPDPDEATVRLSSAAGARVVRPARPGYAAAFAAGRAATSAPFIVTMDADLRSAGVLRDLWAAREQADLVVASRYMTGGATDAPWIRVASSRLLNAVCARVLSVGIHDVSSGCRLYRRRTLDAVAAASEDFGVLPETLVRLYAEGYRVAEVPFRFGSHATWRAHAKLTRLAWCYVVTLADMWRLRNSIQSADYDHRAHDSAIPLQRYWQRHRHRIIMRFGGNGGRTLDVGCGSSRILQDLPGAVGVDVLLRKLRFLHRVHPEVVQASVNALPFPDQSFDTVICSEVIEHIPDHPSVIGELSRVLRPGGTLVLGTPDYGRVLWHIIEWAYGKVAPGGYAHEHITHFDRRGLSTRLEAIGYTNLEYAYVGFCEMILRVKKPAGSTPR
jgi:SAM-dependent methyltransferase